MHKMLKVILLNTKFYNKFFNSSKIKKVCNLNFKYKKELKHKNRHISKLVQIAF